LFPVDNNIIAYVSSGILTSCWPSRTPYPALTWPHRYTLAIVAHRTLRVCGVHIVLHIFCLDDNNSEPNNRNPGIFLPLHTLVCVVCPCEHSCGRIHSLWPIAIRADVRSDWQRYRSAHPRDNRSVWPTVVFPNVPFGPRWHRSTHSRGSRQL